MTLATLINKLGNNLLKFEIQNLSSFNFFLAFPTTFQIYDHIPDSDNYLFGTTNKKFFKDDQEFVIYLLQITNVENIDTTLEYIIKLNDAFIKREQMIIEFEKEAKLEKELLEREQEKKRKELEDLISNSFIIK